MDIIYPQLFYPHPLSTTFSQTHTLWINFKLINMNRVDKLVHVLKLLIFFDTMNMFSFVDQFFWEIFYPQLLIICGQFFSHMLNRDYRQAVTM